MHPHLDIEILGVQFELASYALFLSLSAVATVSIGWTIAVRRGLPARASLACILAMAPAAIAGARSLDAATKADLYARDPAMLLRIDFAGFSMFGGFLLAVPAGLLACGAFAVDAKRLAGSLTPAVGIGISIARVGCYLGGCCFGAPASLPWSVTFPYGSEAHVSQLFARGLFVLGGPLPVHPTQLYEAIAVALAAGVCAWLLARHAPDGLVISVFVAWYAAFRLGNEFLRVPSLSLSVPAWFYPVLFATCLAAACVVLAAPSLGSRRVPTRGTAASREA